MRVTKTPPAARGVNQLMYVGDAVDPPGFPAALGLLVVAGALWWMLRKR